MEQEINQREREVPDYFCGRLIVWKENEHGKMQWCVYDGGREIFFSSRIRAERYCIEKSLGISTEAVDEMRLYYYRINTVIQRMEKLIPSLSFEDARTMEMLCVNLKRTNNQLDTFISMKIPKKWKGNYQ